MICGISRSQLYALRLGPFAASFLNFPGLTPFADLKIFMK